MLKRLARYRIDLLLALVGVLVVPFGGMAFLDNQAARSAYLEAFDDQREFEAEAATYNIGGMLDERDRLASGTDGGVVPARGEVELKISEIARLISESGLALGLIVQGELTQTVANTNIGLEAELPEPRLYEGIELTLSLDGDVTGLLGVSDRILANVPEATFSDIVITQSTTGIDASLSLRVLLYHEPS
jgi:hypothetical protein